MKILYLTYLQHQEGSGVHVRSFCAAMERLGHAVDHFNLVAYQRLNTAAPAKSAERPSLLKRLRGRLWEFKLMARNFLRLPRELSIIRHGGYDAAVIRYELNAFSGPLACSMLGLPFVLEVNAPAFLELRKLGSKVTFASRLVELAIWRSAPAITTVSSRLRGILAEGGVPEARLHTVFNGVDTEIFRPMPGDAELAARYGITPGDFVIGFSGGLKPWHGVQTIIDIVDLLRDKPAGRRLKALIVGDGQMRRNLEDQIRDKGLWDRVVMCGAVGHDDMPRHLALFDAALAPYPKIEQHYFSPLKIFEYMAMGLATIGSDQGQVSELLQDGNTGLLVAPGDTKGNVASVERLMEDRALLQALGLNAREFIRKNYTWEHNARAYEGIIRGLLAERIGSCDAKH